MYHYSQIKMFSGHAAIVKPKAGPSGKVYSEEDWNTEVDENAQGADAYRYSKVLYACNLLYTHLILDIIMQLKLPDICARIAQHVNVWFLLKFSQSAGGIVNCLWCR